MLQLFLELGTFESQSVPTGQFRTPVALHIRIAIAAQLNQRPWKPLFVLGQLGPIGSTPKSRAVALPEHVSQSQQIHNCMVSKLNCRENLSAFFRTKCLITSLLPSQMLSRKETILIQLELYLSSCWCTLLASPSCTRLCHSQLPQSVLWPIFSLDSQSLDLVLQRADLAHEVRGLVRGDGG